MFLLQYLRSQQLFDSRVHSELIRFVCLELFNLESQLLIYLYF